MVWTEKSPAIVMITKLVESGKAKCESYIPDQMESYGDLTVSVDAVQEHHGYTLRQISLSVY